jgi:hypothetical protein
MDGVRLLWVAGVSSDVLLEMVIPTALAGILVMVDK